LYDHITLPSASRLTFAF
jgi:transcription initiation protein SPT3